MVLYLGTVVTGSGPHAGDEDAVRNGLDPLQVSQLHADSVFLFLGLCIGLFFTVRAAGLSTFPVSVLLGVIAIQAAIGFIQYFTDLPIVLVGLHMLGAALVSASVTWVLVSVREPQRHTKRGIDTTIRMTCRRPARQTPLPPRALITAADAHRAGISG